MTGTQTPTRPAVPPSGPDRPHPRIRARRVAVARDRGRRRLRRLTVVLGVVCTGVWGLVVLRSPVFDVDRVQVTGAERTTAQEVEAALGAGPGTPLIDVDAGAAVTRIEALPWVEEARVQRLWPGTVSVAVTERRPVAAVAHPGGWAVVDAEGRILAVERAWPEGLVRLDGRRDEAPGATLDGPDRTLLRAVAGLPAPVRDELDSLGDGSSGTVAELAAGPCLVLGDVTDLEAKVRAALAVQSSSGVAVGRIDVRVPSAPALTRGGHCA